MSLGYTFLPDQQVERTPEFYRICRLPRRVWDESSAGRLSEILTPLLAQPGGTMRLKPVQAQALHDAGVQGGGFFPIRVGGGKTLTSLLCAYVLDAKRPILLIPAKLAEKTRREMRVLAKHWRIPVERIRVVSYELLGRTQSQDLLNNHRPDVIITDESHCLKNPKAVVTKVVTRWMRENPSTKFVAMSGTVTKRSLKDYAHIAQWCLKGNTPIPHGFVELTKWCGALDEKTNPFARVHPGALMDLADVQDLGEDEVSTARKAYRRRLGETPGVVATVERYTGSSIYLDTDIPKAIIPGKGAVHEMGGGASVEGALATLRETAMAPDGWAFADAMQVWACVRQLALGFYYRWNPRPPEPWYIARQAWNKYCRDTIKHPPHGVIVDSEKQVALAIVRGAIPDQDGVYRKWKDLEPSFDPKTEAVWLDETVARHCAAWLKSHPHGIVWSEHSAFGRKVAQLAGVPYFGRQGKDAQGRTFYHPETDPHGYKGPCVASVSSNATGRNLQFWWRDNYLASCPPNGQIWEQLLGRTNRDGQEADEVTATVLIACVEHLDALERACNDARYIEDSTGQAQMLLYADLTLPERWDIMGIPSRRFQK